MSTATNPGLVGISRFFEFSSKFLPGAAIVIALSVSFEWTPNFAELFQSAALVALVGTVVSIVIGQALHSVAIVVERTLPWTMTHREKFEEKLSASYAGDEAGYHDAMVERFRIAFERLYEVEFPKLLEDPGGTKVIYTTVRSEIEVDGRGRARHFQALQTFCRSMWVGAVAYLLLILLFYTFSTISPSNNPLLVTTLPWYINTLGLVAIISVVLLFYYGANNYKELYVDYLLYDFCILVRSNFDTGMRQQEVAPDEEASTSSAGDGN